jgi:tRNA-specific 2-thiouridylase
MNSFESRLPLVVVAMSGGVDSSLAAFLLHQQGYPVVGMSMKLWDFSEVGGEPQGDFRKQVISNFIEEYLQGRTPNPCTICNTQIKWKSLWKKAESVGASCIATGHYARVRSDQNTQRYSLLKGVDLSRDQSYALWGLSQTDLSRTIFPLGELTKKQVRAMARKHELKVAEREESQEICFVADDDYGRFIREWIGKGVSRTPCRIKPGPILNLRGEKLGEHQGIPFYTVGQRRGLGVAAGKPLYVVRIDTEGNAIYVGENEELLGSSFVVSGVNWITLDNPENETRCDVKIRYRHIPKKAAIRRLTDGRILVKFDKPERAITPGQSAVFYDGERVLGGGVIDKLVNGQVEDRSTD